MSGFNFGATRPTSTPSLFATSSASSAGASSAAAWPAANPKGSAITSSDSTSSMDLYEERSCPQAVLKSYKSGDYTDLIISCGDLIFNVHRVVVCSTCDFFKKSVSFGKEQEDGRINLPDDDPEMIRRLIAFCYLGNYDPCDALLLNSLDNLKQYASTTSLSPTSHSRYRRCGLFDAPDPCSCLMPMTQNFKQAIMKPKLDGVPSDYTIAKKPNHSAEVAEPLTIHATMYALADKYQVDGLAALARHKFKSCLHHHVNTNDFVNAVQITYSTTPETNRGLRDTVCNAFLTHFHVNLASMPGIEAKLECIDDLSFLLIKAWPVKTEPVMSAKKPTNSAPGLFGLPNISPTASSSAAPQPSMGTIFGRSS